MLSPAPIKPKLRKCGKMLFASSPVPREIRDSKKKAAPLPESKDNKKDSKVDKVSVPRGTLSQDKNHHFKAGCHLGP